MNSLNEVAPVTADEHLPLMHVSQGLSGSKDGKGIGELLDADTMETWVREYLTVQNSPANAAPLESASLRHPGGRAIRRSIVRGSGARTAFRMVIAAHHSPWDGIRDAVWSGFDRVARFGGFRLRMASGDRKVAGVLQKQKPATLRSPLAVVSRFNLLRLPVLLLPLQRGNENLPRFRVRHINESVSRAHCSASACRSASRCSFAN